VLAKREATAAVTPEVRIQLVDQELRESIVLHPGRILSAWAKATPRSTTYGVVTEE